jgi:hypothetical protein
MIQKIEGMGICDISEPLKIYAEYKITDLDTYMIYKDKYVEAYIKKDNKYRKVKA